MSNERLAVSEYKKTFNIVNRSSPRGTHKAGYFSNTTFTPAFDDEKTASYIINPGNQLQTNPSLPPLTKIVATIGPSSKDKQVLKALILAGMNVARLNFSHGTQDEHDEMINNIREVTADIKRICAIMLDTKGSEIRTGRLQKGQPVTLSKGQDFVLDTDPNIVGDNTQVSVPFPRLPQLVKPGNSIMLDYGLIPLTVVKCSDTAVHCTVNSMATLREFRAVQVPGVNIELPTVTQRDLDDIKYGVNKGVDFIAVSFASNEQDIIAVREALGVKGRGVKIVAKIESQKGLDNFDGILKAADGIMVSRGKLGVDLPIDEISLAQKMLIRKSNAAGKFVITATQMLDSMIVNPSPTRAEASDVANAVFDGTDCVMLSGETAIGLYPVESVRVMADICREAEAVTDYRASYSLVSRTTGEISISEAIASSAVKAAFDLRAAVIVVLTETGKSAHFVAKYRPPCPILTITANELVARQALVAKGLFPLLVGSMIGSESLVQRAILAAKKLDMSKPGDRVVITSGVVEAVSGSTNMLKIVEVPK